MNPALPAPPPDNRAAAWCEPSCSWLIRPGVVSGGLFAFVTSVDEVVLVLFLAGPEQRIIPRQMFNGLRELIDPTILSAATLLAILSVALMVSLKILKRRSVCLAARQNSCGA